MNRTLGTVIGFVILSAVWKIGGPEWLIGSVAFLVVAMFFMSLGYKKATGRWMNWDAE